MPQYDLYHDAVKQALIKDGWTITDDPFIIEFKGLRLYVDLGAERTIAAERGEQKIVVEVKSFSGLPFRKSSLISRLTCSSSSRRQRRLCNG